MAQEIINTIGREAGLKMWDDVKNKYKEIENDNETHYYEGKIFKDYIIYQQAHNYVYGPGSSHYTVNLRTGRPTRGHTQVPRKELINDLMKYVQLKPIKNKNEIKVSIQNGIGMTTIIK